MTAAAPLSALTFTTEDVALILAGETTRQLYAIAMPWADDVTVEQVGAAVATLPGTVVHCDVDVANRQLVATGGWDACFDARLHFRRLQIVPLESTMAYLDGRQLGMRLI